MTEALATMTPAALDRSATAAEIRAQVNLIQEVMKAVMKDGVHYGTIPGTDKPTLYKPGAEKVLMTFRIAPEHTIEDLSTHDEIRYRITVRGISQASGVKLGEGVGECSSNEEKYKWRRPVHDNEFTAAPEDRRREKFTRDGDVWKQVRTEPADVANTILKMAHKRGLVAMTLVVTGASDVFTQDIEDLPEELRDAAVEGKPKMQAPGRKSEAKPATAAAGTGNRVIGKVIETSKGKSGTKQNGDAWQKWNIKLEDLKVYSTFEESEKRIADEAKRTGEQIRIEFKDGKFGRDIVKIAIVEAAKAEPAKTEPAKPATGKAAGAVEDNTPIPDENPEPGANG